MDEHPISWVVSSGLLLERPPFDLWLSDFWISLLLSMIHDSLFGTEKTPPRESSSVTLRKFEKGFKKKIKLFQDGCSETVALRRLLWDRGGRSGTVAWGRSLGDGRSGTVAR